MIKEPQIMKRILIVFLLLFVVAGILSALENNNNGNGRLLKTTNAVAWAKHEFQGFSMKVWISNQIAMGIEAWGNATDVPINQACGIGIGLEYPAGSPLCIEHLFGFGPMIGGIVNGTKYVSQSYSESALHEFIPLQKDTARDRIWRTSTNDGLYDYNFTDRKTGKVIPRLLTRSVNKRDFDDDGDGKVDEDELDGIDNDGDWNPLTDDVGADGVPDSAEIGCNGVYDPVFNPDPAGDDYSRTIRDVCHPDPNTGATRLKNDKDLYTEKNGIPDHGEPHVDEDYGAYSDQDFYLSATDTATSPTNAVGAASTHTPMYVKIFQKSYAWSSSFGEGIIPIDYYFINLGKYTIHNVYIGFNCDADVGPVNTTNYFAHNYADYMPDLRTAYIHNAQDRGSTPIGLTVLSTPRPLTELQYVFQWYPSGALGDVDSSVYGWLKGDPFGNQLIKPGSPPETPADMRVFYSFGEFDGVNHDGFKPGDTIKVSMALVAGEGVDGNERSLRANAEKALRINKNTYYAPVIPPSPKLTIETGFKSVKLKWEPHVPQRGELGPYDVWDDSNRLAEQYPDTSFRRINPPCLIPPHICNGSGKLPGGRIFEGFKLYRSEKPGTEKPSKSDFTLVKEFDLKDDPYEFNVGIESTYVDSNLQRGKVYWYAVTSFGIPNIAVIEIPNGQGGVTYDTLLTTPGESSPGDNAVYTDVPFSVSHNLGEVLVVPNPYRVDNDYTYESGGWEGRATNWTENNRLIKFIHLPTKCTIRVFSLMGDLVTTLEHSDPNRGELEWNILSGSSRALASGVYVFTVQSDLGTQVGKFVLIR
jgi:hypothetical protein